MIQTDIHYEITDTYDDYATLVASAMKSEKHTRNWSNWLRMKAARETAEKEVLKEFRSKYHGLANYEILDKCKGYLENNFPVPSFPYTCN